MDNTTLETLEYPSVLKELSFFTATPIGKDKAERLLPRADVIRINEAYGELNEAREIFKVFGRLPLGGVTDISPLLSKAELSGAFLLPEELILVKNNLFSTIQIKSYSNQQFAKLYPRVSSMLEDLSDESALHAELNRIVDEKAQIKDTASRELFRIRKEILAGKERAKSILEGISSDKKMKEFLQEDIITIRDDRYVLVIKAGKHTNLNGIIHGRSISGASYFIEPFQLVELNNRVAILKKEEKAEEIEILKEATLKICLRKDFLLSDQELLGRLDLLQAKALFAGELKAVIPLIKEEGGVKLKKARHPLLILKEAKGLTNVVPIDIDIPEGKKVLVISGANTGGKTVALKTLGLLTLMVLSGLAIPVEEGSEAVVFGSIFSDIGDRQDIIESLSTFSAHIKRLKEFLSLAGPGSLVLIDEIGAGTDPSEGSALALVTLETFREKGAVTIITTHLNLLKAHAQVDPAYLNASVEFDEKTLSPLYNLTYGVPGPSLGLSIAESLGIPASIIERARGNLKEKEGAFIESVRKIEGEREEIRKLKEQLSTLEARRNEAVTRLRGERKALLEKARVRIEAIVNEAKAEIKEAAEKMKAERLGGKAQGVRKALSAIEDLGERLVSDFAEPKEKYIPKAGDKVVISGSNARGDVLKVDTEGGKAEVTVGSLKVWVPFNKLSKKGGEGKAVKKALHGALSVDAEMNAALSVNIIGMRVEEALPIVTKFLDNAIASGLDEVEIIHGVGTGRLSKAVEEHLSVNPNVKRSYHGDPSRGGGGVTVVELK